MVIQLILIQIITFVVIIAVLHLLFGSQLKIALNRLQVLHQESLEKEEIINKELERARIQSQSEIARSKEEAKNILDAARRNAEKISLEAQERAQAEVKRIIAEASEKAKRMENEILEAIEGKAVELAQELIKYTFTERGSEALHAHFIDELIEELKAVDKSRLNVKVNQAQVITPLALSAEEKQHLKDVLVSKLGQSVVIEEKIDTSLIIGMLIQLGGLVVDGSLKNKLIRAVNALHIKK